MFEKTAKGFIYLLILAGLFIAQVTLMFELEGWGFYTVLITAVVLGIALYQRSRLLLDAIRREMNYRLTEKRRLK